MSMVDITKDLPCSSDGLQMDWIKVPFGPFLPGLPGGLGLDLTLDGDTVARSDTRSLVGTKDPLVSTPMVPGDFVAQMETMMPLAPVSYGLLSVYAVEDASGTVAGEDLARGRAAALERERIASHLSWLSGFGTQACFGWLSARAWDLQLQVQAADIERIDVLSSAITALLRRLKNTPFMKMRLQGMGQLDVTSDASSPIARALGRDEDARRDDKTFSMLDFTPASQTSGDAQARFWLRCDEIIHSLQLITVAGAITPPVLANIGAARVREKPR